jgi:hypothetical protein
MALAPYREPMINHQVKPEDLFRMVGESSANIESALIQVVGTRAENSCLHCLKENGTWSFCVYIEWEGAKICANCHWHNKDSKCYWPSFEGLNPDPPVLKLNDYSYDKNDDSSSSGIYDGHGDDDHLGFYTGGDNDFTQ